MYIRSIKKIYQILTNKEKLIVLIFFISSFIGIIIETISIGTIIPIVSIINESNFSSGVEFIDENIFFKFNNLNLNEKVFLIIKFLIILFSIRFLIQLIIADLQTCNLPNQNQY